MREGSYLSFRDEQTFYKYFADVERYGLITNRQSEDKLGIGSKLLKRATEEAEKRNAAEVHVWTEFENQQDMNLYIKHGFKKKALLLEKET